MICLTLGGSMKIPVKKILTTTLIIFNLKAYANEQVKSRHGMFVVGEKTTYLVHMPMLHKPHDFQLILDVRLKCLRVQVMLCEEMQKYAQLSKSNELVTLLPEPLNTEDLVNSKIKSFQASLYQGHFEKEGLLIGTVKVEILNTVWHHQISPVTESISLTDEYLIFGGSGEYYTTHIIKNESNFNYVAKINKPYTIVDVPCRARVCNIPFPECIEDKKLPVTTSQLKLKNDISAIPLINSSNLLGRFESLAQVLKVINYELL
jgi:hypothetical protein